MTFPSNLDKTMIGLKFENCRRLLHLAKGLIGAPPLGSWKRSSDNKMIK